MLFLFYVHILLLCLLLLCLDYFIQHNKPKTHTHIFSSEQATHMFECFSRCQSVDAAAAADDAAAAVTFELLLFIHSEMCLRFHAIFLYL